MMEATHKLEQRRLLDENYKKMHEELQEEMQEDFQGVIDELYKSGKRQKILNNVLVGFVFLYCALVITSLYASPYISACKPL